MTAPASFASCITRWSIHSAVFAVCSAFGVFSMVGCDFPEGASGGQGEGPGHRQQVLALAPQQELALGRQAFHDVLSHPEKFGEALPHDSPEYERVRNVARRIVRAAGLEPLRREMNLRPGYRYEWEIAVLNNPKVNAFCLPGGKIAVFEGLLRVVQNDDQLATVLAHEIGHALAHHTSERLANQGNSSGLISALINRKFDREQEAEADHIGLFLMTFANYDPREALRFWERLRQLSAGSHQLPEILSDHPSDARRIQNIERWVPYAEAAKRAYEEGRIEAAPNE